MQPTTAEPLASLYETDETAWLDEMARLVAERRFAELDCDHLAEYLSDMARSERREVLNRLVALLAHILKWRHQPDQRTNSWRATVAEQRRQLRMMASGGVLRQHVEAVLDEAYAGAVEWAATETGKPVTDFPAACPYTVEQLFTMDLLAD